MRVDFEHRINPHRQGCAGLADVENCAACIHMNSVNPTLPVNEAGQRGQSTRPVNEAGQRGRQQYGTGSFAYLDPVEKAQRGGREINGLLGNRNGYDQGYD